jgi:hypothetical protein
VNYARWFINSVEYGRDGRTEGHYPWDKSARTRADEKKLAEMLNRAYLAGYQQAAGEMKDFVTAMRSNKQGVSR